MIGRTLSHYQIIDEISRGGMGVVYRALDLRLNREVALKVLPEDLVNDPARRQRLMQEARAASALEHPHIAVIHAVEEAEGVTFIAMELIRGDKLSDVIHRERMPARRALDLAVEVAEGLVRAHEKHIVHRDLKPANVMVTDAGHAKIIDFGLAKLVAPIDGNAATATALGGQTDPGIILGTVAYMSPEQARGVNVDHRSDIFSFGIVLYEMLTGHPPFQGRSSIDTLNAILNQPAPHLPTLAGVPAEASADIQRLIEKCVAKDPDDRYQGMKDVVVDLRVARRHLESSSIPAVTTAPGRATAGLPGRWTMMGAAVVVVAAVAASVLLWRSRSAPAPVAASPDAKPSIAVLYFDNNTGNASLDWMRKGLTDMMVTDLSQSPDIEVLGTDRLQQILQDLHHPNDAVITADIAQQVAERTGVKSVLIGNFIKAGDTIRISVRLQDARTSKIHSAERVEGIGDSSLFSMIDELTRRIKSKVDALRSTPPSRLLGRPGAADAAARTGVDRGLRDITTASIDAYRYYAQGIDLHERSLERQAIPLFEKAISIDPGFAMALIKLAVVENNVRDVAKRDEYAKRALDNVDRVTLREKYYIEGYYYSGRVDTTSRAIEAYTKAVTLYPDHQSARHNLALIYATLERLPESIAQYEELRQRGAVTASTYGNLALCYVASGQVDQALAVMQEYVRLYPEVSAGQLTLGYAILAAGRLDDAMAAVVKADSLLPGNPQTAQARWFLLAVTGQWPEADIVANKMAAPSTNPFQQWIGLIDLAMANLYRGQTAAALAQVDRSVRLKGLSATWRASSRGGAGSTFLDLSKPADALSQGLAGMPDAENRPEEFGIFRVIAAAQASLGRRADADATLARLKQQADLLPGNAQQRAVHWASGEVALARGDAPAAIAELEQAQTMLPAHGGLGAPSPHVPIWFALASAYRAAGKDAESARWFQRVADSGYEHVYSPIQYVRSFYVLGTIAEKQGNLEKARQYYQRFLGYWQNGDIDRDRVADAVRKIGSTRATR